MKTTRVLYPLLFLLLTVACRKDKLTGQYAPLVGKWRWIYSTGGITGQTTFPANVNERTIEFREKGKYYIQHNGNKAGHGRTFIVDDHVVFKPAGFEKAKDELTFKQFYPQNIIHDTLRMASRYPKPADDVEDVYVRY